MNLAEEWARMRNENKELRAENERLKTALELARGMFLDMERGIAPSRVDFQKICAALPPQDSGNR